jgi:hypothetical protein
MLLQLPYRWQNKSQKLWIRVTHTHTHTQNSFVFRGLKTCEPARTSKSVTSTTTNSPIYNMYVYEKVKNSKDIEVCITAKKEHTVL